MPFHSHSHHQHPQSSQNTPTPAQGIYQAAQALGSIGAPTGNLRLATSGTTTAGTDALLPGSGNAPSQQSTPSSSNVFETPRRSNTLARPSEELHMSASTAAMGQHASSQQQPPPPQQQQQQQQPQQQSSQPPPPQQQSSQQQPPPPQQQQQQSHYNTPDPYSATGAAPNINLQQATPGSHYTNPPPSTTNVPGSLQPGAGNSNQRPGPTAAYTAPSTVPTMPHINTNAQQYTLPTRSNTMTQSQNPSHSYSRSSPAGLGPDQKYIPFSHTPDQNKYIAADQNKYISTPGQKYLQSSTPSGPASNSPLGLADIRPRANSSMADEGMSGNTLFGEDNRVPSNSNYLAPWGVYAFDWCKWPVTGGNSAGKMAVGSYLEDTHNFVCWN